MNGKAFGVGLQAGQLKSIGSGLPSGVTVSGQEISVHQAGVTLEGYDLRGYNVSVQANNVTIKNNLFNASSWHTVFQGASSSGLVVEYNTFDGQKANNTNADLVFSESGAVTIRNNEFVNLPTDAVNVAGGTIEHNYFAGSGYQSGAHADAISVHRTAAPVMIRENYIDFTDRSDAQTGTNAAIKIVSHFGAIDHVTIDSNVLLGGGYTIYTGDAGNPVSNVTFSNNDIGLSHWGDIYPGDHGVNFVWQSNHGFAVDAHLLSGGTSSGSAAPIPAPAGPVAAPAPSIPAAPSSPAPAPSPAPVPAPAIPSNSASSGLPAATITGSEKQDIVVGTSGSDVIASKGGVDVIAAGGGNDIIVAGNGKDWMSGQSGDDHFVFTSIGESAVGSQRDVINDFGFGNDKIDLHLIDANAGLAGDQGFHWIGAEAFTGAAGELRVYSSAEGTFVQGTVDADKVPDFEIQVGGKAALHASDFIL